MWATCELSVLIDHVATCFFIADGSLLLTGIVSVSPRKVLSNTLSSFVNELLGITQCPRYSNSNPLLDLNSNYQDSNVILSKAIMAAEESF